MEQLEEQLRYSSTANPSEVTETRRLVVISPKRQEGIRSYGKWMVFRPFTQLDETWHMIRKEIESGVLSASVVKAHCTTLYYDPSDGGPGPSTQGVIIVFTSESNAERAGVDLIKLVKHDIKYKLIEQLERAGMPGRGEVSQFVKRLCIGMVASHLLVKIKCAGDLLG